MICKLTDLHECIGKSLVVRLTLTGFDLESSLHHIYQNDQDSRPAYRSKDNTPAGVVKYAAGIPLLAVEISVKKTPWGGEWKLMLTLSQPNPASPRTRAVYRYIPL